MTPEDLVAALFGFSAPGPAKAPPVAKTVGGFGRKTATYTPAPKKSARVVGFAPAVAS